jgi:hypothetical protein
VIADGDPEAANREMRVNAILARLRLDAPEPLSDETIETLRAEVVPAFVDASDEYHASRMKLEELRLELEASLEERVSESPEGQRIAAAKQALDDSPVIQAAKAEMKQALELANVAAMVDPETAELMKIRAQIEFQRQVRGVPETVEFEEAVQAAREVMGAEAAHANFSLYPALREVQRAGRRAEAARNAMFRTAGITPDIDSGDQGMEVA